MASAVPRAPKAPKHNPAEDPKTWSAKLPAMSRLAIKDQVALFKYLGVMIDAGIPLERALMAIHGQTRSLLMHRILHGLVNDITSGEFFSSALRKMPQIFDKMLVGLIEAGENSGTLAASLFRISENLEKSQALNGKIRTALLYPGIVVVATAGITSYLLFVLLPQITPLFTSMNLTLPLPTRIIIAASDGALAYWQYIVGGLLFVVASFFTLLKTVKPFRYAMHALALRVPVFGPLLRKIYVAQFAQILGTLLKSGITIIDAIKIAADAMGNLVYQKVLHDMADGLQQGANLSTHFTAHRLLFPPLVSQMISVGEETGKLDESFLFISKFSEREVDEATKNLTTILEPLLMLVIGGMVGFIAIAIISPIYQLTKGVKNV